MMPFRRNMKRRAPGYLRMRTARITTMLVVGMVRVLLFRLNLRRWVDGDVEVFSRRDVSISINQLNANRPLSRMPERQARKCNGMCIDKLALASVSVIHRRHEGRDLKRDPLSVEITIERDRCVVATLHPGAGRHEIQLPLVERILKSRSHFGRRRRFGGTRTTHAALAQRESNREGG